MLTVGKDENKEEHERKQFLDLCIWGSDTFRILPLHRKIPTTYCHSRKWGNRRNLALEHNKFRNVPGASGAGVVE